MNKIYYLAIWCIFIITPCLLCSCDVDDVIESSTNDFNTQKITAPSFDKFLSTTNTDGFSIRVRFKTGGDKENNIHATVHWKAYSQKPSSKPSKSDLTKIESMRQYGAATYHNTGSKKGMTESIVFDKSHAGYNGGTYIYYYVECTNSVDSDESPISYEIVKR